MAAKIANSTKFPTKPLRILLTALVKHREWDDLEQVTIAYRPRGRPGVLYWNGGRRRIALRMSKSSRGVDMRTLASLLDEIFLKLTIADPVPSVDWAPLSKLPKTWAPVTDKRSREEKIADKVDQRRDRAVARVAGLEKKLAQLKTNEKRLKTMLKKAKERVRYYERKEHKSIQERDFIEKVRAKAAKAKEEFDG